MHQVAGVSSLPLRPPHHEALCMPPSSPPTLPPAWASNLPGRGDEALVWDTLVDCLRDQSELGAHIGRGWLLKLLLASAEQELQR